MKFSSQDILFGSSLIFENQKPDRVKYFLDNMENNKAYTLNKNFPDERTLNSLKDKFKKYRKDWNEQPALAINSKEFDQIKPLCIDLEVSSFCDLACPHCSREYLATPDKLINLDFAKKIIMEASEMEVPSIKFNWRGEPLLNKQLPNLINFAKSKGILETIINTNATNLDKETSNKLLDSGLDYMIFSFDGGSKSTYEKYRPGRFKKNLFEKVYENIKNFSQIKKEKNLKFPYTKIQMVMIQETKDEINEFFNLFRNIVDDVSVTQYNERGANLENLTKEKKDFISKILVKNNLDINTPYLINAEDEIFVSIKRKACFQPFQRIMVTYNGKTGMCCLDWGAKHNIGYLSEDGFDYQRDEEKIIENLKNKKKGFELLKNVKLPNVYNNPEKKVSTLKEIWHGKDINKVRLEHLKENLDNIQICKECNSSDTFEWKKIN